MTETFYQQLQTINQKPNVSSIYDEFPFIAATFWNDPYISQQLLKLHLHPEIDLCSRRHDAISQEIKWINNRFNIGVDTRICDFGCGPGLYTTQWAKRGAQVTGIDISEGSLSYARKQAVNDDVHVDYINQNFLEYSSSQKYDLITMIFNVYNDLDDRQRAHLLKKFHTLLNYDGVLILDVSSLSKFAKIQEKEASFASSSYPSTMSNFWCQGYHYLFSNCFKYDDEHITLTKYTVINSEQIRDVYIWIKYYSLETLKTEFAASGFDIIEYYADFSGARYHPDSDGIAIIAKKI